MKIVICDDDKRIRENIAASVREVSSGIKIETFENTVPILEPCFDADILFLDIQMPGVDGMNAARILRSNGKKTVIVFVTALEELVFKSFDVGAFNYVVKPFTKERIQEVIKNAIKQAKELKSIEAALSENDRDWDNPRTTIVKSEGMNRRIILSDIRFAEIFDRKIVLHMSDDEIIEYYGRISELEKKAGIDFYRPHRAYLINLKYVESYDSKAVHMSDDDIPIARGKYPGLIKAYMSYHTRREEL